MQEVEVRKKGVEDEEKGVKEEEPWKSGTFALQLTIQVSIW
jgi:hypothetical protein